MSNVNENRRRRSKRTRGSTSAEKLVLEQLPWKQLQHNGGFTEVATEEQLEMIHNASMQILEEVGIDVLNDEARRIMIDAGARLDSKSGTKVFFDRGLIMEKIATAPKGFTLHARNPAHSIKIGDSFINFGSVGSAPNTNSLDGGRRPGNQEDYQNFLRLTQHFNIIHFCAGYPVEPVDIHPSVRHLHCLADCVRLMDKPFHAYSLGKQRNLDALEIARIGRGINHAQLEQETSLFTVINSSSPLRLDDPMLQGIIEMSSLNQAVVLTPFTLAGAMAPVTIAGALAQQNAEALAGIAFTQMVRAGAPAVYGGFTSNVDMKSGSPAFGTPEYLRAGQISGQLARKYQLPFRSSNVNAANSMDAQSGYESTMALWGAISGGSNFVMHGAGWMEGGLSASFEKFVMDVDLLQMMAVYLEGVEITEESLAVAVAAVKDVGPGGHFFGTQHTMDRYKDAFYAPLISDWRNFESWQEAGSPDALQKANHVYKQALDEYQQPELDIAIEEELEEFVQRRVAEGGVATDF